MRTSAVSCWLIGTRRLLTIRAIGVSMNCLRPKLLRRQTAPALRYEDECLTYLELNEQANQLAHYLRSKGVRQDSLVGLCVDRSLSMMVAVLAILKAGGAYVPLSAEHPKPRLLQQLDGASALLTEAKFESQMPSFGGPIVLIDRDRERWAHMPVDEPTNRHRS